MRRCLPLQETSCGQFAGQCVSTTARIIADAACCMDVRSNYSFVRNFTPKPMPTIEVRCAVRCCAVFCVLCAHETFLLCPASSTWVLTAVLVFRALQAAASSAVESLIDMQGCLVVIISNSRWVVNS